MSKCKNCKNIKRLPLGNWCAKITDSPDIERDRECPYFQIASNADRIRSMNDIEMSMDLIPLIMEICEDGVPCEQLFLKWLQSEAE